LFCSYEIHRTRNASDRGLGVFGKALDKEGCMVFGSMTFELSVQKFLNIKLISWLKIFGEIGMCLGCCWKDLDEQDLMEFIW
jgi:hypothetical protein